MKQLIASAFFLLALSQAQAADLKVGDTAPAFTVGNHKGQIFKLDDRKGKGWTVLYFYPKADTPGCTKQACAFRDSIKVIRAKNAEIYGISTDTVDEQAAFHKKHNLNFDLLADADAKITESFGAKMPVMKMSKRWTFVLDPELKIRWMEKDVDPAYDAQKVATALESLQKK